MENLKEGNPNRTNIQNVQITIFKYFYRNILVLNGNSSGTSTTINHREIVTGRPKVDKGRGVLILQYHQWTTINTNILHCPTMQRARERLPFILG